MYDERFKGQGFDRIQQICELYVAGFTMLLLDNAFVIHDGFKEILKKILWPYTVIYDIFQ